MRTSIQVALTTWANVDAVFGSQGKLRSADDRRAADQKMSRQDCASRVPN